MHPPSPLPLAVDVTIVHPLRLSNNTPATHGQGISAADSAERAKIQENGPGCSAAGWACKPFALETTGALGTHANNLCRQLAKRWAMRHGRPVQECSESVRRAISTALAQGWAEMLAAAFRQ
jgi:hypothetical protein